MSCTAEWKLGAYADDALDSEETRTLEAHLVGCEHCRRSVVALREEARLIARALAGDLDGDREALALRAPAQGVLFGFPLSLAAAVAAATGASILLESQLPAGLDWLHPSRAMRATDMFWNLIFVLRDDAPGWLEWGVAVAALASVAAIGAFVAGALMRRYSGAIGVALLASGIGMAATPSQAAVDNRVEPHTHIEKGQRIDATLIVRGETVTIDGTIDGDLIAWAERVRVNGTVLGNVIAGGEDVEIAGVVRGSLFAGGDEIRMLGTVDGSAFVGAGVFDLEPAGSVAKDLTLAAWRGELRGKVGRDVAVASEDLRIEGQVVRDVFGAIERLTAGTGARIGGDVIVHTPRAEGIDVAPGSVGGEVRTELRAPEGAPFDHFRQGRFYIWRVVWLAGAFLAGLLLYGFAPKLFDVSVADGSEFGMALGVGVASVPLVVLGCAFLALTVVGLPLAILLAVVYGLVCYLSFLVVAALVGRHIVRAQVGSPREFGLALLVGLALVTVLVHVPFIGGPARWVIVLTGVGLLGVRALALWRERSPLAV